MNYKVLVLILVVLALASCEQGEFSPGPKGPLGPQGDLGPQGNNGPSSDNAIDIKGTGVLVENEYSISGFTEVEASDFFDVEISQGESYRIMVEADEAIVPYIDIDSRGNTLRIGLKDRTYNMQNTIQRVEVTLPALSRASIGNHTELILRDIKTDDSLVFVADDFSELRGVVDASDIQILVDNHSEITLSGSASQLTGDVSNHSSVDLIGLGVSEIDLDVDDFSTVEQ